MADMSLKVMLDDTNVSTLESHASGAYAVAGYVNGSFANWAALVGKYASSGKFLLSIDVKNAPSAGAQCLDVEKGDATNADAPGWVKATRAAGMAAKDLRWFPKIYTSASNATALIGTLTAAGVARDEYMLWTAHYTGKAHICNKSCGFGDFQADATQWTDSYDGASLDCSQAYGYFFSGAPDAVVSGLSDTSAATFTDFGWGAVAGVTNYDFQLCEGATQVVRKDVAGTHLERVTTKPSTAYRWRVAGEGGSASWSAWKAFTTPAAPKAFAAPASLSMGSNVSASFTWPPVAAVDGISPSGYTVQVLNDEGKTAVEKVVSGTSVSLELPADWGGECRVWANDSSGKLSAPPHASIKFRV